MVDQVTVREDWQYTARSGLPAKDRLKRVAPGVYLEDDIWRIVCVRATLHPDAPAALELSIARTRVLDLSVVLTYT